MRALESQGLHFTALDGVDAAVDLCDGADKSGKPIDHVCVPPANSVFDVLII